jgi:transcription antitermination factor NusG
VFHSPVIENLWFIVLTEPNQDLTTVWRLHELGKEMFVPVIRDRVKTRRTGKNGQKVTRVIARPMFPGYGFLRKTEDGLPAVLETRGVRDFMRNEQGEFATIPDAAVRRIFGQQTDKHREWISSARQRKGIRWKSGDAVRVDDGSVYDGMLGTVEQVDIRGRIKLLMGQIRWWLPADMVVAA